MHKLKFQFQKERLYLALGLVQILDHFFCNLQKIGVAVLLNEKAGDCPVQYQRDHGFWLKRFLLNFVG